MIVCPAAKGQNDFQLIALPSNFGSLVNALSEDKWQAPCTNSLLLPNCLQGVKKKETKIGRSLVCTIGNVRLCMYELYNDLASQEIGGATQP